MGLMVASGADSGFSKGGFINWATKGGPILGGAGHAPMGNLKFKFPENM